MLVLAAMLAGCGSAGAPRDRGEGAEDEGGPPGGFVPPIEAVCDADGDGYMALPCAVMADRADCDDADPTVHPGADETLDGVDEDCDGDVDEGTDAWDADGDCVCVASACTGSTNADCPVVTGGDCDDADPGKFPGNVEVCNGEDDDCDDVADDGLPLLSWWIDVDGDGWGSQIAAPIRVCGEAPPGTVANNADCDDLHANVGPSHPEIACDALDNDCDPSTPDGVDEDHDGVDHCFDCDDQDPNNSPANEEICDDRDNDCDGDVDDGLDFDDYWRDADADGYGDEDEEIELCDDRPGWVDNDDDCNDGNPWVNPSATESYCDGVDNDCDDGDWCPW